MIEFSPIRVRIKKEPPCRLECPAQPQCVEGPLFDRHTVAGRWGWIMQDMELEPVENTSCGHCGRLFAGRNVAVEQGAPLLVIMDRDLKEDRSFDWEDCYTFAREEVRMFGVDQRG